MDDSIFTEVSLPWKFKKFVLPEIKSGSNRMGEHEFITYQSHLQQVLILKPNFKVCYCEWSIGGAASQQMGQFGW